MDIAIDDEIFLRSDPRNIYLARIHVQGEDSKNPGEEVENPIGFYGSLEAALQGYKRLKALRSQATTFAELRDDLHSIDKRIKSLCEQVGVE